MRRALVFLAVVAAGPLAAQSSQFGVRGLGLPGRELSVASLGQEGADGLFDGRSARNPAALGLLTTSTLGFQSLQAWRSSDGVAGAGSTREQRFPLLLVGGPIPGSRFAFGLSYATYADRDFTMVSTGVASPRGVPLDVTDTLGSTGGINDLRLAGAWTPIPRVTIGIGGHLLTGSNRVFSTRAWSDTSYRPVRQSAEITYAGAGISGGVILQPTDRLLLAGTVRRDFSVQIERDSSNTGSITLPWTLAGGARYRIGDKLALAGQVSTSNWSVADAGLVDLGGVGARNTVEVSGGVEWVRNVRRPERFPLRIGARFTELPFLVGQGSQPRELGLSLGTAFRFAGDLGGVDLALERVHRTQGTDFAETGWHLSIGVSLRRAAPAP